MAVLSGYTVRSLTHVLGHDSGSLVGRMACREILTGNRTYYVRTDGSDSNTGQADNAGGAKLTVQGALDVIEQIDFNGFRVTLQIRNGTFTGNISVGVMSGQAAYDDLLINGDGSTPANVVLQGASGDATVIVQPAARCKIEGVKFVSSGASRGVRIMRSGFLHMKDVNFGNCTGGDHIEVVGGFLVLDSYTISGSANQHIICSDPDSGIEMDFTTATAVGSYAFDTFIVVTALSFVDATGWSTAGGATFTGKRYDVTTGGIINTNGGGASFFPGDSVGTTSTGGQYF